MKCNFRTKMLLNNIIIYYYINIISIASVLMMLQFYLIYLNRSTYNVYKHLLIFVLLRKSLSIALTAILQNIRK